MKKTISTLETAIEWYQQKHIPTKNIEITSKECVTVSKAVLNQLVCSNCLNYLSIGPVTLSSTGEVFCGRSMCTRYLLRGTILTQPSVYNNVVRKYVFNCNNHYDGCEVILPFSNEMKEHEVKCRFEKQHKCFLCNFLGNGCQLIHHYKNRHPEVVAEEGVFEFENAQGLKKYFIFPTEEQIIEVSIEIVKNELKLWCVQLNSFRSVKMYSVVIFIPTTNFEYISGPIQLSETCSVNLSEIQTQFYLEKKLYGAVQIHNQFPLHFIQQLNNKKLKNITDTIYDKTLKTLLNLFLRSEIICCNCNVCIRDMKQISFCPQSHITCNACLTIYCTACGCNCSWLSIKDVVEDCTLLCDWKKCKKEITCLDFLHHKLICSKREYTCPTSACTFIGNKDEISRHWHDSAKLKFGTTLDFTIEEPCKIYWIIDYFFEMLCIEIKRDGKYAYIEVHESCAIFPNNYKLELMYAMHHYYNFKSWGDLSQRGKIKLFPYSIHGYDLYRLVLNFNDKYVLNNISLFSSPLCSDKASSETVLKSMLNIFFKTNLKCCNCSKLIQDKVEIYFCVFSHSTCKNCCFSPCKLCSDTDVHFTILKNIVKDLTFFCDWPDCGKTIRCYDFLKHKQICFKRQYKLYNFIGRREELLNEYENLKLGSHINFKIETQNNTFIWLSDPFNELFIIEIRFDNSYPNLRVLEDSVEFPNNFRLQLLQFTKNYRYEYIGDLKQVGNMKICQDYIYANTKYRLTIENK